MVIENEIRSYLAWLLPTGLDTWHQGALFQFLLIVLIVALAAVVLGFLAMVVRYGPARAGDLTYKTVSGGVADLLRMAPSRVLALAWLSIKESWRRQAIIALVVYAVILAFASFFLKTLHQDPAKVQLDFVLSWTTFLMLLQGLLLSAFSLPGDFKTKTIYTIVTKPVRSCEIALGRILGFTAVGTLLLAVMGVCSYLFVNRILQHTHTVDATRIENVIGADGDVVERVGETSTTMDHSHAIRVSPDGLGEAESAYGHWHAVSVEDGEYEVGPAEGFLRARVPKRADIRFLDREGVETDRGVSVGSEWQYRSYVAGGTNAAAIWTFENVTADDFETVDGVRYLPVELVVRVFRTYKGDIEKAIRGRVQLRNPDPENDARSEWQPFPARDMSINSFAFTEQQFDAADQQSISILDDLVHEGRLEVVVQCIDRGQYFGFARADCYIRMPEGDPLWNFVKAHLGIWVQMTVVITIGVLASTFLNGPIAALLTVSFITLGFFRDFFLEVATEKSYGGGPVESLVRLITQMNLTSKFSNEEGFAVQFMKTIDDGLEMAMRAVASVLPDFPSLSSATYVAQGYDIPTAVLGRQLTIALAYVVGLTIAGSFLLRTREVAK